VFAGFTDEEQGLVDRKFYVRELGKAGLEKMNAVVNLAFVGTGPTKVRDGSADRVWPKLLLADRKQFQLPINVVNAHKVGRSGFRDLFQDHKFRDQYSFPDAGDGAGFCIPSAIG